MREQLEADAKANNRSLNAEIVARLLGEQRTLRDWFAGQALVGLLSAMAHPEDGGTHNHYTWDTAEDAYRLADAMLAERAKGGDRG